MSTRNQELAQCEIEVPRVVVGNFDQAPNLDPHSPMAYKYWHAAVATASFQLRLGKPPPTWSLFLVCIGAISLQFQKRVMTTRRTKAHLPAPPGVNPVNS